MKTRRLSEIDLARFIWIDERGALERALRGYNAGGGAWSYDPVRQSTSDILDASTPLYGPLPALSWLQIKGQIERACKKGPAQIDANVQVGKVLYDAARKKGWTAIKQPMGRMPIGIGETVRYWCDVVIIADNSLIIPFFDHRRDHGIVSLSVRRMVHSMQHLWVRERNLDLENARLAIVRFPCDGEDRNIQLDFCDENELLSYEELDTRVRIVYETWARVSAEKSRNLPGTGTDDSNPFDF